MAALFIAYPDELLYKSQFGFIAFRINGAPFVVIQYPEKLCYGKKYLFIWLVGQDTFPHLSTSEMPTWVRPWM